jgi:hypothetical protein
MKKFIILVTLALVFVGTVTSAQAQLRVCVPKAPSACQLQGLLPQGETRQGGHYVQNTTMEQQVQYVLANGKYYENVVWVPVTRSVWVPDPVVVYVQPQVVVREQPQVVYASEPSVGEFAFAAAVGALADHLIFGGGHHGGGHRGRN